jgi:hypothetical protein
MINLEVIKKFNPCEDRLDNYVSFYGDKSFTPRQFMGLKNITHADKLWAALRLLPKDKVRAIAADIAESVLHIYEEKYPNDARPREVIAAARAYARGEITEEQINERRKSAYTAAYDAAYDFAAAAYSAAYAAAYAADAADAAYAAYAAGTYYAADAAYAAAYSAAAYSADATAATYAATYAAGKQKQEKLIRTIILKYWKE